jgi:hypothetical protein
MNDYTKRKEPHRDFYGWATHGKDGILNIGTPGPNGDGLVGVPLTKDGRPGWFSTNEVAIYVTRYSDDGSIAEISMDIEDGLTYCDFDFQSEQGKSSPLGPKEYARNELVGKHVYEDDNRIMTNEDFEFEWSQFEEGIYGINWVIDRTNL